jgi:hypothetical protein
MSSPAIGARVRLLHPCFGVSAGAEGTVIGFYARKERTVVVRFGDTAIEVEPELLEPVTDAASAIRHDRG